MSMKSIRDAFQANGMRRDTVSNDQIEEIYVRVTEALSAGQLRDLIYDEQIYKYVRIKLEEIKLSRDDWLTNWR